MIEQLIAALEGSGFEPTATEIADALWLAVHMPARPSRPAEEKAPHEPDAPQEAKGGDAPQERSSREVRSSSKAEDRTIDEGGKADIHAGGAGSGPEKGSGQRGMAFRSPAAPGLPHKLELSRALRPLKRRAPSRTRFIIDEEATVQCIAEEGLYRVILTPAPERWLDAAVVVDEGSSMVIWQKTVDELASLLEHFGAFRKVARWGLSTDEVGELRLFSGGRSGLRRECRLGEVVDPGGRRIVFVVSDCVSRAWDDGRMAAVLAEWGRHGPVVILEVLPEKLWHRSGLGAAVTVRLRAPGRGAPNARLTAERLAKGLRRGLPGGVAVPVGALEASSLKTMAQMIAGGGEASAKGVLLRSSASLGLQGSARRSEVVGAQAAVKSAEERVAWFRASASAQAWELSTLFAAAPLSLPVMRLIQDEMLPESTQGHLAEVFLGGLLCEVVEGEACPRDPDDIRYDFLAGVRELLLDSTSLRNSALVLLRISEYVEKRAGQSLDFRALLADPTGDLSGEALSAELRPFAKIGAQVLERFGGEYAKLAKRLRGVTDDRPPAEVLPSSEMGDDGPGDFMPPPVEAPEESEVAVEESGEGAPEGALPALEELACRYESIRERMRAGDERTREMNILFRSIQDFARRWEVPAETAVEFFARGRDGDRIVALGIWTMAPHPLGFSCILDAIAESRSAFEQSVALDAATYMLGGLSAEERTRLRQVILHQRSGASGTWIREKSRDRWERSERILEELDFFSWEDKFSARVESSPDGEEVLFTWIHISDIQMGLGYASRHWDQKLVLAELLNDIREQVQRGVVRPDVVLVTGDVAFSGNGSWPAEYDDARTWLDELCRVADVSPERVFLVPGNHDVSRWMDGDPRSRALLDGVRAGEIELDDVLMSKDRGILSQRMGAYLAFARGFAQPSSPGPDGLFWLHHLEARGGLRVRLVGLNTALLSADDQDHGRLRLGKTQIALGLGEPATEGELVVVMSHHPLRSGWLADEKETNNWLRNRAHIHLSGHLHESDWMDPESLVRVVAGLAHEREEGTGVPGGCGYSFGTAVRNSAAKALLRIYPRRWSNNQKDFRVDLNYVPHGKNFIEYELAIKLLPLVAASRVGGEPLERKAVAGPIKLFISYSHADKELLDELERRLAVLKRHGVLRTWHDQRLVAGEAWASTIKEQLESADIILLLVSADFLASDHCFYELKLAIERQTAGQAIIVPTIIRTCDWHGTPLARFQVLPRDGRPVTRSPDQDEAWRAIVREIHTLARELERGSASSMRPAQAGRVPTRGSLRRVLDRVLPSDSDFDAFCLDFFTSIYGRFTHGMSRIAKVNLLLQHASPDQILKHLREFDPETVKLLDESIEYE